MSLEWGDAQVRLLINERKERNVEFHSTPNKKKCLFWDSVAEKINEQENTNYFIGEECQKKFKNLVKAFSTAKKYRDGTGVKKSLIGEKIYEEFSTMFWMKPELPFERVHNESIRRLSKAGTASQEASESSNIFTPEVTSERRSSGNPSKKISKVVRSSEETYMESRPTTPSTAEPHTTSRPVTPTLPSFSQSANVINVTINNNYAGTSEEQED